MSTLCSAITKSYLVVLLLLYCTSSLFAIKATEGKNYDANSLHGARAKTPLFEEDEKSSYLRRREQTAIQNNTVQFQGDDGLQSRIYGGTEVPVERYPYLAGLFWINPETGGMRLICGGTLIAPSMILTAAHCSDKVDIVMLGIYNFTNMQNTDYEYYRINPDQKVIYPYYDPDSQAGDFLLLKLDQPSKFYPIKLNTQNLVPGVGQQLTVMGWGLLSTGLQSTTPQETVVEAMANEMCSSRYGRSGSSIGDNELCASEEGHDSCQGDSGGPLIIKAESVTDDILVASVSWGYDCADSFYPGVYARISSVKHWLKDLVPDARYD